MSPCCLAIAAAAAATGVLEEVTGRKKNRVFVFRAYTNLFPEIEADQGPELPPFDVTQSDEARA